MTHFLNQVLGSVANTLEISESKTWGIIELIMEIALLLCCDYVGAYIIVIFLF